MADELEQNITEDEVSRKIVFKINNTEFPNVKR